MSDKISLITYLFFYFFIFYSIIGYGWFFSKFLNKKSQINLGYQGIYGLFFFALYSYFSHHFFPHGKFHNFIIISVGFFFYIYFFIYSLKKYLKSHLLLLIIVCFIFISSLLTKNADDFPYYHFGYTYYLTQYSSVFGIGVLNHGFRTPSSIFYIGSLFYLPIIKYYTFHFVAVFVLIISNYIFIKKIINFYKLADYNFIFFYCLLCFSFINIVFYRIGEHGTDRSAQILVLILILELLAITNIKNYYLRNYYKIFLLIGLIVTFKAFYILYSVFIIYSLIYLYKKVSLKDLFIKNVHLYLCCLLIVLSLFATFQNTGCFLYPITYSCIGNLPWSIDKNEILLMSNWYELWSKGGAAPNFRVENPDFYIQGFNWVSNWAKIYAYPKVTNTALGIVSICLIIFITFATNGKKEKITRIVKTTYLLVLLILVVWFVKHPALRYGGFCLVALMFFIPTSLQLEKYIQKNILKKIVFIFSVVILIFIGRNINRINSEAKQYSYNFLTKPTYNVEESFFQIPLLIENLISNFDNCKKSKVNCQTALTPKVTFLYNKYVFYK